MSNYSNYLDILYHNFIKIANTIFGRSSKLSSGKVLSPRKFISVSIVSWVLIWCFKMSLPLLVFLSFTLHCWFLIEFEFATAFFYLGILTLLTKNTNCLFRRHVSTVYTRHVPPDFEGGFFRKSTLVFLGSVFVSKVDSQ